MPFILALIIRISLLIQCVRLASNLALNIRSCVSLCLSKKKLKAVGSFYLVSMPVMGGG